MRDIIVCAFSDTDGFFRHRGDIVKQFMDKKDVDIWIANGNITNTGTNSELMDFLKFFGDLNSKWKIFMPGYLDLNVANARALAEGAIDSFLKRSVHNHYLNNSGCTIEGKNFWACPYIHKDYCPRVHSVFREETAIELNQHWEKIPVNTDVLLTVSPPYGILDYNIDKHMHMGNEELYFRVREVNPEVHCFSYPGSAGHYQERITTFINTCMRGIDKEIKHAFTTFKLRVNV